MSYDASVYKVMVASPSDVKDEHEMVSEVISEWNIINSETKGIILMPIGWESHSHPEMGERPQEILNRQLLGKCDLLVAVFWTRLGSPTGKSTSGTVEEIEEHLASGKPAMIYFSSALVRPDSVDDSQYKALLDFKDKCKQRGLIEEYESIEEFRDKFRRQLAQIVNDRFPIRKEKDIVSFEMFRQDKIISEDASELLLEAAKDQSGTLIRAPYMGGINIETNEREFVTDKNPRTAAKWEGAIQELEEKGFIKDRGYKHEVFDITHSGYEMADQINKSRNAKKKS